MRTPLSKTWPWAPLQFYLKTSCFPPLRPWPLALAPVPWLGVGGAPFVFCPLFFLCFPPLLQLGDHADNRLRGEIRTSFGRFGSSFDSDSVEAQATSGSPRPCLATKTSESCANSAKRSNQQRTVSSYLFGVVAERPCDALRKRQGTWSKSMHKCRYWPTR